MLSPLDPPIYGPVEVVFPATPRQSYEKLCEMLARAGERINDIEESQARWYIGYYIQQVFSGIFNLPPLPGNNRLSSAEQRVEIEAAIARIKDSNQRYAHRDEFIFAEEGVRGIIEWKTEQRWKIPKQEVLTGAAWIASIDDPAPEMYARAVRVSFWQVDLYRFQPIKKEQGGAISAMFLTTREPQTLVAVLELPTDEVLIDWWLQGGPFWEEAQQRRFARHWKEKDHDGWTYF